MNLDQQLRDLIRRVANEVFDERQRSVPRSKRHMRKLLETQIKTLCLPVQIINALRCNDVCTLGDLVQHKREELSKLRNLGNRSLQKLDELLQMHGLAFGMDVSRYGIPTLGEKEEAIKLARRKNMKILENLKQRHQQY